MKKVTFYHSMICPRCHAAGFFLSQLSRDFPDVEVTRVEFLTNQKRAGEAGVRSIPALVSGEKVLTGFFLGKARIRTFLESL